MITLLPNVCKDIEDLKKQYGECSCGKVNDIAQDRSNGKVNNFKEFENNIDNLNGLLKSMEQVNNEVINNKNLLKNVLDEDHEVRKKYIEKIKNIINAYVSFYDYVDGIRQSLQKSNISTDISLLKLVNSILVFLEKEYSNIGLMVHIPNVGVDKFDSFKHEIVVMERKLGLSNGTILGVVKKGFYYNDRNIRYVRNAKVITVSN